MQPQIQQQVQQHPGQQQQQQQNQQQQSQPAAGYTGVIHDRRTGDKVHFCICCQAPIAIYGRLLPCLHAFCLTCAADMPKCFICLADINRMERVAHPLFVSAATLQSFTTEESIARHTQQLYAHLSKDPKFVAEVQPPPGGRQAAAAGGGWSAGRGTATAAAAAAAGGRKQVAAGRATS